MTFVCSVRGTIERYKKACSNSTATASVSETNIQVKIDYFHVSLGIVVERMSWLDLIFMLTLNIFSHGYKRLRLLFLNGITAIANDLQLLTPQYYQQEASKLRRQIRDIQNSNRYNQLYFEIWNQLEADLVIMSFIFFHVILFE